MVQRKKREVEGCGLEELLDLVGEGVGRRERRKIRFESGLRRKGEEEGVGVGVQLIDGVVLVQVKLVRRRKEEVGEEEGPQRVELGSLVLGLLLGLVVKEGEEERQHLDGQVEEAEEEHWVRCLLVYRGEEVGEMVLLHQVVSSAVEVRILLVPKREEEEAEAETEEALLLLLLLREKVCLEEVERLEMAKMVQRMLAEEVVLGVESVERLLRQGEVVAVEVHLRVLHEMVLVVQEVLLLLLLEERVEHLRLVEEVVCRDSY